MGLVAESSLSQTIDNVNDKLFFGNKITKSEAENVCDYISSRFGLPGSYYGLFAPSIDDTAGNVRFFTGEPIKSRASIAHILSEESMRILKLLNPKKAGSQRALMESKSLLSGIVADNEAAGYNTGMFCCGNCSTAYWRNLMTNTLPKTNQRIALGLKTLKERRIGNGRWKTFPFYQTSLVLTEMEFAAAKAELKYAAPVLEKATKRKQKIEERYRVRRSAIAEKALEII